MIEKIHGCKNNPKKSPTTKVCKHIPSGFSMSTILPYTDVENKDKVYGHKDCMKKFGESLREHTVKITDFKKIILNLLTNEKKELYKNAKTSYIC